MSSTPASSTRANSTPDARSDAMPAASPRPGAGTPSDYRFPHFATRILANGLRLIVANLPAYPVVTTLAVIEAGATRDPRDYEGLAQLTTRALAEGTRDMNALELTSRLEMLGTTLAVMVDAPLAAPAPGTTLGMTLGTTLGTISAARRS